MSLETAAVCSATVIVPIKGTLGGLSRVQASCLVPGPRLSRPRPEDAKAIASLGAMGVWDPGHTVARIQECPDSLRPGGGCASEARVLIGSSHAWWITADDVIPSVSPHLFQGRSPSPQWHDIKAMLFVGIVDGSNANQ